ncbi:YhgE/Pip domain-containing protein [Oerskovia turbata]
MSATTGKARGTASPWTVVGVVLLPLLVLGLLLWALWSPQDRLGTVRAAIVNLDEPVEIDGQLVPLGRQLAAGLVSGGASATPADGSAAVTPSQGTTNYDWVITDADDAAAGLADGTYAAVVTVPADFSAAATSFGGDAGEARQATVDVTTAPGGRMIDDALARIVTTTATQMLGTALTEQYVDGVLTGFTTLGDQLGEAADGARQLADGAVKAGDGARQLADGAGQVATGAGDLASGVGELSQGARGLATGTGQAAAGAATLAQGADQLAGGARSVADGAAQLSAGLGALDAQVQAIPGSAAQLAQGAQGVSDGVAALVATTVPQLEAAKAAAGCDQAPSPICAGIDQQIADLRTLAGAASAVAAGNAELSAGLPALVAGVGQVADGSAALASGADQTATGARDLASGAKGLSTGLSTLDAGTDRLVGGIGALDAGADALASGTQGLTTGAQDLATGVDGLAGGSADLAGGLSQATDALPAPTDAEAENLAGVVANPVTTPGVEGLGTGATGPMFAVLALWLGALALFVAFPPVPVGALGSTRGVVRLTVGAFARPGALAALTGVAVGLVLAGVEGASLGGWLALAALGALASVAFAALNQAVAALLGGVGRAVSLLVAVLVVATGVVATVPGVLISSRDLLPVGPALDALVAVTEGTGGVGGDVVVLALWLAGSLAVTALVVRRRRTVRVADLLRD